MKREVTHGKIVVNNKNNNNNNNNNNNKTKKKGGKKKRENMAEIGACINRPSFPSLLANPLFEISNK